MNWQKQLQVLELYKEWDFAIELMKNIIADDQENMDAYISMNYLLMNLLVEEDYDRNNHDQYASLIKKYFDETYAKFSENAEYLYYTGITAFISEWYFGIEVEDARAMLEGALQREPDNI